MHPTSQEVKEGGRKVSVDAMGDSLSSGPYPLGQLVIREENNVRPYEDGSRLVVSLAKKDGNESVFFVMDRWTAFTLIEIAERRCGDAPISRDHSLPVFCPERGHDIKRELTVWLVYDTLKLKGHDLGKVCVARGAFAEALRRLFTEADHYRFLREKATRCLNNVLGEEVVVPNEHEAGLIVEGLTPKAKSALACLSSGLKASHR